jgi:hypothetical protein
MRFIFTSKQGGDAHVFSTFDTKTKQLTHYKAPDNIPVEVDEDCPFGITWSQDNLYVATPGRILVFDSQFKYQQTLLENLSLGIHQILLYDERLWMVSPRINAVKIYSFKDNSMKYFCPKEQTISINKPPRVMVSGRDNTPQGRYLYDVHHFNSILIKENKLYISAHNFNLPSFLLVFSYHGLVLQETIEMGFKIHDIGVDDAVYVCDSSGTRRVISNKGHAFSMGAHYQQSFLRGMVITDSHICATHFPFKSKREDRRRGHAYLSIVHRLTGEREEFKLENVGNVNDLRILDEWDYAHGIKPFLPQR